MRNPAILKALVLSMRNPAIFRSTGFIDEQPGYFNNTCLIDEKVKTAGYYLCHLRKRLFIMRNPALQVSCLIKRKGEILLREGCRPGK